MESLKFSDSKMFVTGVLFILADTVSLAVEKNAFNSSHLVW